MHSPSRLTRTHKISLLIALYLAQGLPYGFFTQALPVLLREAGYSLKAISALSLLYLPWALKFLWAPWLDHRGTPRRWLLTLQGASIVAALSLTQLELDHGLIVVLVAAFVFNIIAASQDVVTDGLAVRMLDAHERGYANGIQVGAYRLGMIFGAGVLLIVFARTSWSVMFACMAVLLALTMLPVLSLPATPRSSVATMSAKALLVAWLRRMLMPGMLGFAALVFCYRFGDAMVSNVLGPFLSDSGLDKETIGWMKGTVGNATSLLGAALGGWYVFRVSRRQALLVTGLAQALTFVLYVVASFGVGGTTLLWVATVAESVIGTTATVALFTLMMDASDPEHAGTDYTLFASFFVVVNSAGTLASATIVDAFGYAPAFIVGTVLAVAGVLTLVRVLDRQPTSARIADAWR
ncbi:MFS transporter [Povalibacter sp.]|uniref:MFS transporter n=1 Tax=Povalibacter sp. TaxID=1962978 RepID=UPI002F42DF9D